MVFADFGMMTVEDAAHRTGVRQREISRWARTGEITAKFVGRMAVLPDEAIGQIQAKAENWTGENGGRKSGMYKSILRDSLEDYMNLQTAASLVGRDTMTIRRWIEDGSLQGYRFGLHEVYVNRFDVENIRANIAANHRPFEPAKG